MSVTALRWRAFGSTAELCAGNVFSLLRYGNTGRKSGVTATTGRAELRGNSPVRKNW